MDDLYGDDSPFAEPPEANDAMQAAHREISDVAGDPLDAISRPDGPETRVPALGSTMSSTDEQTWSVLAHASGLIGLVGPPSFLGPLFVYLLKKNESPRVRANAAEALNFQITAFIAAIVSALLIIVLIGIVLLGIVAIGWLAFTIIASVKASNGEDYRYPINLRLVS